MSEMVKLGSNVIEKPSIEQVAWVLQHIHDHMNEGGTFRYLIYERLGFGPEAYVICYEHGGMAISNGCFDLREARNADQENT